MTRWGRHALALFCAAVLAAPAGSPAQAPHAQERTFNNGLVMAYRDVVIGSKLPRQIAQVPVEEGDVVKAGDLLIELDNAIEKLQVDLARQRKENASPLRYAEVSLAKAQLDLRRLERLREGQVVSEIEFDRVKAQADLAEIEVANQISALEEQTLTYRLAEARLEQTRVTAPIGGICVKVFKRAGEYVDEREDLVRLIDIDQVLIDVRIPMAPGLFEWLTVGAEAIIECHQLANGGDLPKARVTFVSPLIDPASNTVMVRLVADNPGYRLKPGMTATVCFR